MDEPGEETVSGYILMVATVYMRRVWVKMGISDNNIMKCHAKLAAWQCGLMMLCCVNMASKFVSSVDFTMRHIARAMKVCREDVRISEIEMLDRLEHRLWVEKDDEGAQLLDKLREASIRIHS